MNNLVFKHKSYWIIFIIFIANNITLCGEDFGNKSYLSEGDINGSVYSMSNPPCVQDENVKVGPFITKEIKVNQNSMDGVISGFIELNDLIYFIGRDEVSGIEVFVTDGTEQGTQVTLDINPGVADAFATPSEISGDLFVQVDDKILFTAYDGNTRNLWISDGTIIGTKKLSNIEFPQLASSSSLIPNKVILEGLNGEYFSLDLFNETLESIGVFDDFRLSNFLFNGSMVFAAGQNNSGLELWRTDGTSAGTFQVANLLSGPDGSVPNGFTALNNKFVFAAADSKFNSELWISDGTASGTNKVKEINLSSTGLGPSGSFPD